MATRTKPKKRWLATDPLLPACAAATLDAGQVAAALRITTRSLRSMIATGTYPRPDLMLGRHPRWLIGTHNDWIDNGKRIPS